jgi:hypothetical protein
MATGGADLMQLSLFPPVSPTTEDWNADNWETPDSVSSLMARLILETDNLILEPCAGYGQIVKFLPSDRVIANELNNHRYRYGLNNILARNWLNQDFLTSDLPHEGEYDLVITNPPFSLCCDFIAKGLSILNRKNPDARLLFLLPLDWNCPLGRSRDWSSLDAHIYHEYRIRGRVAYLDHSRTPQSRRQCSDAVFDIRPGKKKGAVTYL